LEKKKKLKKKCVSNFKKKKNYIKKKLDVDHVLIVKKNLHSKFPLERQLTKKRLTINASAISNFFGGHGSLQKR